MSPACDTFEVVTASLDVDPDTVRASAALLTDQERRRASRFAFERDRRRFTVARAGLRKLLALRLGSEPASIELTYGANGKPTLGGACASADLRFNVSHSEDLAVYAFVRGREIGIDVEAVRRLRDADGIAARFFSRRENAAYIALEPRDRPQGFFNCWTRKEAFVKALGEGLSHPLDTFDVSLAPCEPARILRVEGTTVENCGWTMHGLAPRPGFIAAVVTQNRPS